MLFERSQVLGKLLTRQVKMLGLAAAKPLVRFRQLWAGNPERK